MPEKRKNILLILSDQQRLDTISAYQNSPAVNYTDHICRTPNIDSLAAEGMKFEQAFTSSAICAPSRASIMTGLFAHNHGVIDNFTCIKEGIPVLGDLMKDAGYTLGYAGKWHVDPVRTPEDMSFHGKPFMGYAFPGSQVFPNLIFNQPPDNKPNYYEEYLKEKGFTGVDVSEGFLGNNPALQIQEMYCRHDGPIESTIEYFVAQEAMNEIDRAASGEQPFFIWANFWGPHSPSIVPEPYFSMYDPAQIPEHPSYKEDFADKPYGYYLTEKMWGLGDYGWPGFADICAKYYGHCTFLDDMVGLIINKLKEKGLYEDTIIIYASDHGDCLGAHKLIEKGCFAFEEIYHVPLIVKGLGTADSSSFVYLHELMPSILELAGAEVPENLDGRSLLAQMQGQVDPDPRTELYGEFHDHFYHTRQRLVHDHHYWLTFNESERGELYDLAKDPFQLHNVCYDLAYASVKKEYMDKLGQWIRETNDPDQVWFHRIKEFY